jgi:hypothetical protein
MPLTSKINISPMLEEKHAPIAEEPTIYASKTVSPSLTESFCTLGIVLELSDLSLFLVNY